MSPKHIQKYNSVCVSSSDEAHVTDGATDSI